MVMLTEITYYNKLLRQLILINQNLVLLSNQAGVLFHMK